MSCVNGRFSVFFVVVEVAHGAEGNDPNRSWS